ncbi:DUF3558 domain-containing protein [Actinoalloteichus caeruleus]|uniref:DUF3558 domain-containing protein n=1 Tax=Actinoalloteichus cyanogriseus TaxID=2893586 RepID=UPI003AB09126
MAGSGKWWAGGAVVLVAGVVVAYLAVALPSGEAGQAHPGDTGTAVSSEPEEPPVDSRYPPVENPIDMRALEPCDLLPPDAAEELGLAPEGELERPTGPFEPCLWRNRVTATDAAVYRDIGRTGLGEVYDRRDAYAVFTPITIEGYPAVAAQHVEQMGNCQVFVGTAHDQQFVVQSDNALYLEDGVTEAEESDPCARAADVARAVLVRLPAGD